VAAALSSPDFSLRCDDDKALVGAGNGYAMYDIIIHDNVIHDIAGEGILIDTVDPSKGPVQVYNNIMWYGNTTAASIGLALW
jgi:hypothetical protein